MMISQDVKVSFLFLILNGFFHPKTFVNEMLSFNLLIFSFQNITIGDL